MKARATKVTAAAVAILLSVLAAALLTSAPSQAEGRKLLLSAVGPDGPWSDNLPSGLFDGDVIAPGEVTETFWVLNNSPQPARVTLDGQVLDTNPFADSLSIESNVGGTVVTTPVGRSGRCKTYVTGPSFNGRTSQRVDVTLHFDDDLQAEQSSTMNQSARLEFLVTLSQTGPKGKVTYCEAQAGSTSVRSSATCATLDTAVVAVIGRSSAPATCTQPSLTTAMAPPG